MQKVKYLSNRDLLAQIQRSKATFSSFLSPEYATYDVIAPSVDAITPEFLTSVIATKASKLSTKAAPVDPASIDPESIVFRVMTDVHIPPETDEKRRRKSSTGEGWTAKTNFPPFKHYILKDGEPFEVGRSHWKDGLHNGSFSIEHGKITDTLARSFMLLVDQLAQRGNWRGYSYVDEMKNHALMHLSQVGLQFDESRSDNPFAFYTQIVKHCFTRILNLEKRNQNIRDDLLIMAGAQPSYTRQVDNDLDQREYESRTVTLNVTETQEPIKKEVRAKRGRKPKVKV